MGSSWSAGFRLFGRVNDGMRSIREWNAPELWRDAYAGLADGPDFLAENFLGEQYRLIDGIVCRWDPETGEHESLGAEWESWQMRVETDPSAEAPVWLLEDWEAQNGRLSPREHLAPRVPFVLEGEFDVSNLYRIDAVSDLRWRAQLATQVRTVPDGASVRLHVKWEPSNEAGSS